MTSNRTLAVTRLRISQWGATWAVALAAVPLVSLFSALLLLFPRIASAATPPSLAVNPTTVLSGDSVIVSGTGFPPKTRLMIWLDTNGNGLLDPNKPFLKLPIIITDASGAVAITPWVLTDVPAGRFSVYAGSCPDAPAVALCVGNTLTLAQTQLTVNLGVNYSTFGSGTTVSVTGFGFAPGTVFVWYDRNPTGPLGGSVGSTFSVADANGAFSSSLPVKGDPGDYFIHAGSSTMAEHSLKVNIGTCWLQECTIDGATTICLLGHSPSYQFLGFTLADCKKVDSNYTNPTRITASHDPPGGYDLDNVGPVFMGAGVLAAAANELGLPGSGCAAMGIAITNAEVLGNSVPNKLDGLLPIACAPNPFTGLPSGIGLGPYIFAVELSGHAVPDKDVILPVVAAVKLAGALQPPLLALAQAAVAQAAVAGAIACGFVNYYCNGSDITKTILENPGLQTRPIPLLFLQPPITSAPNPNPCTAVGTNANCWGGLIGWSKVTCKTLNPDYITVNGKKVGICERPDVNDPTSFPQLAIPGSAGSPDNSGVEIRCATGTVVGLSIGYDGDVSFDITGPDILRNGSDGVSLINYHNSEPGPGGSAAPDGLDIEIPLEDKPLFMDAINRLRPGMTVHVCGRWVADMHMLWNELHPITSLSIGTPLRVTADNKSRAYGAANPAFTVSYNGFVNGDTESVLGGALACRTTATSASPGGTYFITCSGQTSATYAITYVPGTLTITPVPLTIAADNASRPYSAANPPFTSTPSGLLQGDTLSSIGASPVCTTSAKLASPVGIYPITCGGPASTTSYTISYSAGTLTITPAALPSNGQIVFRQGRSLVTVNPDGTGATIVAMPSPQMPDVADPAWSQDGKRIAFISGAIGVSSLNVMNADGSGLRQVTSSSNLFSHPTWSPDGSQIAFAVRDSVTFHFSIWVIKTDGTGLRNLLPNGTSEPAWSPDGQKIAVAAVSTRGTQIALVNADGTGLTRLTSGQGDHLPAWSPDGAQIAFESSSQIYRIKVDGTGLTKLSNGADSDGHPSWSPDGTRIVFGTGTSGFDIWTMSARDGSGRVHLTNCDCAESPDWQPVGAPTLVGSNVIVEPVDRSTGTSPVTLTFSRVTGAGRTSLVTSAIGPAVPLGFKLGSTYYYLDTTATFAGTIQICITVPNPPGLPPNPKLLHYVNNMWETTPTTVNGNTICGTVTSLSPFVIAEAKIAPPVVEPIISGRLGNNGWYTSDVVVSWSVTPLSDITSMSGCEQVTLSSDTAGTSFPCTASTAGGTTSKSVTIKRDATPPAITVLRTPPPNANGWNNTDVTVSFTASALSGIALVSSPVTLTSEGANQVVTGMATSLAGLSASVTVTVNIDKTPPTIAGSRTPPANAHGWNNTNVTVSFACTDSLSGLATCLLYTSPSPRDLSTSRMPSSA